MAVKSIKESPLTPVELEMIKRRTGHPEGTRPTAAPMPPPGHYWVREMQLRHAGWFDRTGALVTGNVMGKDFWGYYSWDKATLSEWFIVRIGDMGVECIASDENVDWDCYFHVVTHVSARIDPPEDK